MTSSPEVSRGLTLYQAARQLGLPFTNENQPADRSIDVHGLNLHYLEWGDVADPAVLMLHGASQQAHSWDFVSLALSEQFHILALDQRGHGDSDWAPDGDYSVDAQEADIDGFVEAVGLDSFVLIGHSMGARNAYFWASRHPEPLKGLVIVDTGPEIGQPGQDRIRRFRELPDELDSFEEFADRIQEYTGRSRAQVLGSLKHNIHQRTDGKWTWKYDKAMRTPTPQNLSRTSEQEWKCIHRIDCPTLVVRGERSDLFREETMNQMRLTIPDCTTVTIPRAGHLVQGDNPVDFVSAVMDFLHLVA